MYVSHTHDDNNYFSYIGSHKGTFASAHDPETIFLMKDFLQAIILIAFKIYKQR